MQSLVDLCINKLVELPILQFVILDRIPYDLYKIYKRKKLELDKKTIRPIVKCILAREIYIHGHHMNITGEFRSIHECICGKGIPWFWYPEKFYFNKYYPDFPVPHPLDDRFNYSQLNYQDRKSVV